MLDCGAGVGRISQALLTKEFEYVDLLEPAPHLIQKARDNLMSEGSKCEFYETGMENFQFKHKYDSIWIQWVIGHLTDPDLVAFLTRCRENLSVPSGVIVLKDNVNPEGFYYDTRDNSIARSSRHLEHLLGLAGLEVCHKARYEDFPLICLPVWKLVLRPARATHQTN